MKSRIICLAQRRVKVVKKRSRKIVTHDNNIAKNRQGDHDIERLRVDLPFKEGRALKQTSRQEERTEPRARLVRKLAVTLSPKNAYHRAPLTGGALAPTACNLRREALILVLRTFVLLLGHLPPTHGLAVGVPMRLDHSSPAGVALVFE